MREKAFVEIGTKRCRSEAKKTEQKDDEARSGRDKIKTGRVGREIAPYSAPNFSVRLPQAMLCLRQSVAPHAGNFSSYFGAILRGRVWMSLNRHILG